MNQTDFKNLRLKLNRTQRQLAHLLGTSLKAVQSYEQGWRVIPTYVERQMFFLVSRMKEHRDTHKPCWVIKKCPSEIKKHCPAWEFQAGKFCWLISGTTCDGNVHKDWEEKMTCCRACQIIKLLL